LKVSFLKFKNAIKIPNLTKTDTPALVKSTIAVTQNTEIWKPGASKPTKRLKLGVLLVFVINSDEAVD